MTDDLLIDRGALFAGPRDEYRRLLWRVWEKRAPLLVWIMLNPSTADHREDDTTIKVCCGRAHRQGRDPKTGLPRFGGIIVANLFQLRAIDPTALYTADDPIGPAADEAIGAALEKAGAPAGEATVIAAWGEHGGLRNRDLAVIDLVTRRCGTPLSALLFTAAGAPRHPLRINYSVGLTRWRDPVLMDGGEG